MDNVHKLPEKIELKGPTSHIFQARLNEGTKGVKSLSQYVKELHALIEEYGSDELKNEMEKIK